MLVFRSIKRDVSALSTDRKHNVVTSCKVAAVQHHQTLRLRCILQQ
jgi:hypothetical protein